MKTNLTGMKKEIYDKNYSNASMNITPEIWNNSDLKGIQKMMMAFYKKLTKEGTQSTKNLTIMQSQIFATHLKDIEYNQQELVKKGFIKLTQDVVLGEELHYTYNEARTQIIYPTIEEAQNPTDSLF